MQKSKKLFPFSFFLAPYHNPYFHNIHEEERKKGKEVAELSMQSALYYESLPREGEGGKKEEKEKRKNKGNWKLECQKRVCLNV